MASLCKTLSLDIKNKIKEKVNLERYKFIVQVSIGEKKGQGVRIVNRCFWDFETDNVVSETYTNDNIYCLVTAYGVYCY